MIYLVGMKKVRIKYISHIFQNRHIDKIEVEEDGYVETSDKKITLSFIDSSNETKEKTTFIFLDDEMSIIRGNSILEFNKNQNCKCQYKTEYGSMELETKLKKYFRLGNEYVINYELLIDNESIGKYIIRISYKELS